MVVLFLFGWVGVGVWCFLVFGLFFGCWVFGLWVVVGGVLVGVGFVCFVLFVLVFGGVFGLVVGGVFA
ncbi:hypothetical protein, partial [Acinetobacter baumannii]